MRRPRAADYFSAIRERMEELRRERAQVVVGDRPPVTETGDQAESGEPAATGTPQLPPAVCRLFVRR
jgi:hypothetical protein